VKEPERPGWIFVATVVLACFVTSGRLSAQKDQEARSSIVGEWTLDKKLSDVAEDRPHERRVPLIGEPRMKVIRYRDEVELSVLRGRRKCDQLRRRMFFARQGQS